MQTHTAHGRENATRTATAKIDISKVETEDLINVLMLINSRPRKCLNYVTPFEKFLHQIGLKKISKKSGLVSRRN